jgi:hypothetical protein
VLSWVLWAYLRNAEVLWCEFRGLQSCGNFIGSHHEDDIGGDDGNMIAVETFSVVMDAQVTHEDDRQMLSRSSKLRGSLFVPAKT